jgi:hypothetical protein
MQPFGRHPSGRPRERFEKNINIDFRETGCVVKVADVAGCVSRMAVGWSWLCCKDGSRMELAVL